MKWTDLCDRDQIDEIDRLSGQKPVLIFKHSSRCAISSMALRRLKQPGELETTELRCFYLDIIGYRALSNAVAQHYDVTHESPQILLIKEGQCVFDTSHNGISQKIVQEQLV